VARNILVALDSVIDEQGWGRKIPSASGATRVAVVTAGFRAGGARAKTDTGSRCVIIGASHGAMNARKVSTSPRASDGQSEAGVRAQERTACPRNAAQTRQVRVHQGSKTL
jgi:hypothetical protein